VLDPASRTAVIRGVTLDLSPGEFDILSLLAANAGEVVRRDLLYQILLETQYDPIDRSIDLRVSRLRQKIAARCGDRDCIKTVRGIGYLFNTRS
jgi:DNA-binding response OmpR family regulator